MTAAGITTARMLLRLYVVAGAPNSIAARSNLAAILARVGKESYALEIVDCVTDPHRALKEGVLVTPTLVKLAPDPAQTIVGSLSDRNGVAAALGLVIGADSTTNE